MVLFRGIVSGLFASGGGLLLIPIYLNIFKCSEKEARATAIFCILPMVLTTMFFYNRGNYINYKAGFLCATGGVLGSFIGSKLLNKLNSKHLKLIFIVFLIYSSIKIILN